MVSCWSSRPRCIMVATNEDCNFGRSSNNSILGFALNTQKLHHNAKPLTTRKEPQFHSSKQVMHQSRGSINGPKRNLLTYSRLCQEESRTRSFPRNGAKRA